MNKSGENKIEVFQNRSLDKYSKSAGRTESKQRSTEDADMKNLSKDFRRRRLKFIEHILRKGYDNDCRTAMTWAPE